VKQRVNQTRLRGKAVVARPTPLQACRWRLNGLPSLPTVFLCLPTSAIGGAEKRFSGLWRYLSQQRQVDVVLVVQRALLDALSRLPELNPLPLNVSTFEVAPHESPRSALRKKLTRLHEGNPDAIFHYVMMGPAEVQRFSSQRTLFSEPVASLSLFNWKGRLSSRMAAMLATKTDVLDASVREDLLRYLPAKAADITVTPGSFVDLEAYRPAPVTLNRLTFIGLFTTSKQAFRLARAVPAMDRALKRAGVADAQFRFLGRETQQPGVREILAECGQDIDASSEFEFDPGRILAQSKVVFGLQQITNYPSKALLEGMAAGALPIVTDVGETRRIATEDFAQFVSRDFTDDEIAEACVRHMTLDESVRQARVVRMREHLRRFFSIEAMADYYLGLYRGLASGFS
jgi:glycosyltransferase involved in cell wall biosynthesis